MSTQPACPECERLSNVSKQSDPIGQFLEWMKTEKHLVIARYMRIDDEDGDEPEEDGDEPEEEVLVENGVSIERLLADYFNIDLEVIEKERQALLKYLQEMND